MNVKKFNNAHFLPLESRIEPNVSQRCHLSRRDGFNFSLWRGRRLRCITASNGRMDEKGATRIKRVLSMGPWFSVPNDLYFCTRSHVTLIHLPLRMYRFVCSRTEYMHVSYVCTCMRMYVCTRTYIHICIYKTSVLRHYRRNYGELHGFRTFFHFSWNFSSSAFYRRPFFHLADCFPKVLYFVPPRVRARAWRTLFARLPFPVGRDNALPMCIKFAYNFKKTGMRFSLRWHMIVCLLINTHVMRCE